MPRAYDPSLNGGGLPIDHNPLSRIDYQNASSEFNLDAILQEVVTFVEQYLFPAIKQITGVDLSVFLPVFTDLDFSSPEAFLTSFVQAVALVLSNILSVDFTDPTGFLNSLTSLFGGQLNLDFSSPEGFISSLVPALWGLLQTFISSLWSPLTGFGQIGTVIQNLLANGGFESSDSVQGFDVWNWISGIFHTPTDGSQTAGGSAMVLGNGKLQEMVSDPATPVSPGQELDLSQWVKWTGVNASGNAFQLLLDTFSDVKGTVPVTSTTVDTIANVGMASSNPSEGDFEQLAGSFTVPPTGVSSVRTHLVQTANVLSGQSYWSDASLGATQKMAPDFVDGLVEKLLHLDLFGLFDASGLKNLENIPEIAQEKITGLITTFTGLLNAVSGVSGGGLSDIITRLENLATGGLFDASGLGNILNIPQISNTSVSGVGTGTNIGDTMQSTWDFLWSGFSLLTGNNKTVADMANAASVTTISAQAAVDLGQENSAILAVRKNAPLYVGVDEATESTFLLSNLGGATDPLNFAVTQSTAPMGYIRISQSALKGFVSWFGKGFASISALYIDIYHVDTTTGDHTLLHNSADQSGMVGSSWAYLQYFLPSLNRIGVMPGDVLGIELRVVGAGTHTIAGLQNLWMPDNTLVRPKRLASARNAGTGAAPSTIIDASVTYSGNQPWFGFGIASGDTPAPVFLPRSAQFTTPGAYIYPLQPWMNTIDVAAVGAGGGGQGGSGAVISGDGGTPGAWTTKTLVRGVDFPSGATSLTGVVGDGGAGGVGIVLGGVGTAGAASTVVTGSTTLVTAAGGAGGSGYVNPDGAGPGNMSYKTNTYFGGPKKAGPVLDSSPGNAPGGAGPGGQGVFILGTTGGKGAPGAVYFVGNQ